MYVWLHFWTFEFYLLKLSKYVLWKHLYLLGLIGKPNLLNREARPVYRWNTLNCFSFVGPERLFRAFSDKIEKEIKNFSFPDLEYVFYLNLFQKNR